MDWLSHAFDLAIFTGVAVFYKIHDRKLKRELLWNQQQHTKILVNMMHVMTGLAEQVERLNKGEEGDHLG